jgi:hypothetical protein
MDVNGFCQMLVSFGMPAEACQDTGSTIRNAIPIFQFVIAPLISGLTLAFWVWTWRAARERTMFRDVEAQLKKDHRALDHTLHSVVGMLGYPGAAKSTTMPVYDAGALVHFLNWVDWPNLAAKPRRAQTIDAKFNSNIESITGRLNLAILRQQHFARQLVIAKTVHGGLIASQAGGGRIGVRDPQGDKDAMTVFEEILKIPGWENSWLGHELVGLQHERLGQLQQAHDSYDAMLLAAEAAGDTLQQATAYWRRATIKFQRGTYQPSWTDTNSAEPKFGKLVTNDPRLSFRTAEFYELRFGCAKAADYPLQVPIAADAAITHYGRTIENIRRWRENDRSYRSEFLRLVGLRPSQDPWDKLITLSRIKIDSIQDALQAWLSLNAASADPAVATSTPRLPIG